MYPRSRSSLARSGELAPAFPALCASRAGGRAPDTPVDDVTSMARRGGGARVLYVGTRYRALVRADFARFQRDVDFVAVATMDLAAALLGDGAFVLAIVEDMTVIADAPGFRAFMAHAKVRDGRLPVRVWSLDRRADVVPLLRDLADVRLIP